MCKAHSVATILLSKRWGKTQQPLNARAKQGLSSHIHSSLLERGEMSQDENKTRGRRTGEKPWQKPFGGHGTRNRPKPNSMLPMPPSVDRQTEQLVHMHHAARTPHVLDQRGRPSLPLKYRHTQKRMRIHARHTACFAHISCACDSHSLHPHTSQTTSTAAAVSASKAAYSCMRCRSSSCCCRDAASYAADRGASSWTCCISCSASKPSNPMFCQRWLLF